MPSAGSLHKLNWWLAGIYVVEAVAVGVVGRSWTLPVSTSFLTLDSLQSTTSGRVILSPATKHLFDLNLQWVLMAVFVVAGIVVGSQASWYRARYELDWAAGRNRLRWAGYSITAGFLFVLLALAAGVYNLASLLAILLLTVVVHVLCSWSEDFAGKRAVVGHACWAFVLLSLAGLGAWMIVLVSLIGSGVFGAGHVPVWVYGLAATTGVTCLAFAWLVWRQAQLPRRAANYRVLERRYLLLTFLTTSVLTWQIVAGALL